MSATVLFMDASAWTWIVAIAGLVIGGYFALDRLMRKGIYDERRTSGSAINSAFLRIADAGGSGASPCD